MRTLIWILFVGMAWGQTTIAPKTTAFTATFVRGVSATSAGANCTIYNAASLTAGCALNGVSNGSTIIAACTNGIGTSCSISDGTAYTGISVSPTNVGSNGIWLYYRTNVTAGNYTVTATSSGGGASDSGVWALEIKGAGTVQPIGVQGCAAGSGLTINTPTLTGVSAASAVFFAEGSSVTIASAGGGYTGMAVLNGNGAEYKTAVTAGSYSANFSQPSGTWQGCGVEVDATDNAAIDGDVILDLTGATNGTTVSAANLATGTKCGSGAWANNASSGMTYNNVITPAPPAFLRNFFTCGTSVAGNNGITVASDNTGAGSFSYTPAAVTSSSGAMSAGFWYMTDATNVTSNSFGVSANFNIQNVPGTGTAALVISRDTSGNLFLDLEQTNGGSTFQSTTFGISRLTWYWISIQLLPSGTSTMKIYNSSGTLQTTLSGGGSAPSGIAKNINIGPRAGSAATTAGVAYIHNLVLNYTTGSHIPPQ